MPDLEPWSTRLQADLDEVEEVEQDWEELRHLDVEIEWLIERGRRDLIPPPWRILEALMVRVELGRMFLRVRSWEALYQMAADEPQSDPPRALGPRYWPSLASLEEAIAWLEVRLKEGSEEGQDLMLGLLDRLIDRWEEHANGASGIPRAEQDA